MSSLNSGLNLLLPKLPLVKCCLTNRFALSIISQNEAKRKQQFWIWSKKNSPNQQSFHQRRSIFHSEMAASSLCLSCVSNAISKKLNVLPSIDLPRVSGSFSSCSFIKCSKKETIIEEGHCFYRRPLLLGLGALPANLLTPSPLFAEEIPKNYRAFVDSADGYSYVYPSDWRDFDFRGHDSAFKDKFLQLQNVRVRFIPTEKTDIHEMGPMEEYVSYLVRHRYAAPNQVADILDMQEKSIDGKNYYTFEYQLTSPNYASTSFATIAIGNGRYYTLVVAANERRWRRYRSMLKVVADSFRVLDI